MTLQFIDESQPRFLKTIFYGIDGSGKSTGAKIYCDSRELNPVVIDFDYTNYTGLPRLKCDWDNDRDVINGVINIIRDVEKNPKYDTLIIDGVGTFNNLLLPKGKESQRTYLVRTQNFKKIWKVLLHANIHVIFIGQKDMIVTEENESSKFAELINNMVDYKFHCIHTGKGFTDNDFTYVCTKTRGDIEPLIGTPIKKIVIPDVPSESTTPEKQTIQQEPIIKPGKSDEDPVKNQCILIKDMLEKEGKPVNKSSMRSKVIKLINEDVLPADNRPALINYINKNCPEGLE